MTHNHILALLIEWAAQHETIEGVYDALTEITGGTPESPLFGALWHTFELYGQQLEARILGTPDAGWLSYYHLECDMGAKAMRVDHGAATYTLGGIEALADMLHAFAEETKTAQ